MTIATIEIVPVQQSLSRFLDLKVAPRGVRVRRFTAEGTDIKPAMDKDISPAGEGNANFFIRYTFCGVATSCVGRNEKTAVFPGAKRFQKERD